MSITLHPDGIKAVRQLVYRGDLLLSSHACTEHGDGPCSDRDYFKAALEIVRVMVGADEPRYGTSEGDE